MSKINFYIRKHGSDDGVFAFIDMVYWVNGVRMVYPTRQRIDISLWNKSTCRALSRKGRADLSELNHMLDVMEERLRTIERKAIAEGVSVTKDLLRDQMDILMGRTKKTKPLTIIEYGTIIIDRYKKMGKYTQAISSTLYILKKMNRHITFNDVDVSLHDDILIFMRNQGYSKNYEWKIVTTLKMLMNMAVEEGLTNNTKFKSKRFKAYKEDVYNTYLTLQELELIHNHEFKEDYLDNARDLLLIGCFTGLRFGDYSRLTGVNFVGGEFIIQDTMKVDSRTIVPQHRIVKEVLKKRNGELPRMVTNQRMNEYIKEVCRRVGIDTMVIKTRTVGGVKKQLTFKKYEVITTHTARRSLATNMYLMGIPLKTIAMITGHSNIPQLMKYIKITEQDVANSLLDHPFFK